MAPAAHNPVFDHERGRRFQSCIFVQAASGGRLVRVMLGAQTPPPFFAWCISACFGRLWTRSEQSLTHPPVTIAIVCGASSSSCSRLATCVLSTRGSHRLDWAGLANESSCCEFQSPRCQQGQAQGSTVGTSSADSLAFFFSSPRQLIISSHRLQPTYSQIIAEGNRLRHCPPIIVVPALFGHSQCYIPQLLHS